MPQELVETNNTNDPITLSVSIKFGHKATSVVMLNHIVIATKQDDFTMALGANNGLKNNTVIVTTSVLKTSPSIHSEVDFTLTGAQTDPLDDASVKDFPSGVNVTAHNMV